MTTGASEQRRQEQQSTEDRLNTEATAKAGAVGGLVTAVSSAISALPPPVNGAAQALATGVYQFLTKPPAPLDVSRASRQLPGTPPSSIDPVKLFALQIGFAVILALWCFIKSLLHPIPIVGMFFPLCDDPTMQGEQIGATVHNPDDDALRNARRLIGTVGTVGGKDGPAHTDGNTDGKGPGLTIATIYPMPGPVGMSFDDYARRHGEVDRDGPTILFAVTGSGGQSSATGTPPQQSYSVDWVPGDNEKSVATEQLRRLFGL